MLDLARAFDGLYFETGQGSEVTNGTADGVDMGTLEARSYGVARHIEQQSSSRWMIVNDVAGFIGPEVFRDADQLERVCLEDVVMAKLHGLTMGLDVCATFHMGIAPQALRRLTARVVAHAAPAYLMSVAGNADPMLGYLTTSFREHPRLRSLVGRDMTTPMRRRLTDLGVLSQDGKVAPGPDNVARLYAAYAKAGGDRRTLSSLEDEGRERLHALRAHGFDLGIANPVESDTRLEAIYAHARDALYAGVDEGVIRDAATRPIRVRTVATSRDQYLAQPASGERLRDDDARAIGALYPTPVTSCAAGDLGWPQCQRRQRTLADAAARIASRAFAPTTTSVAPTSWYRTGAFGQATRLGGWSGPRSWCTSLVSDREPESIRCQPT